MVVDDVLVYRCAVGRTVIPPDLVIRFVRAAEDLVALLQINIVKYILTQGAGQSLHTARVHVELVRTHPVRDVVDRDRSVGADDGQVVAHDLKTPDVWSAQKLHGVDRGISPDQNLLASLCGRNDPRAGAEPVSARLVGDRGCPVAERLLVSPANLHRVLVNSGVYACRIVAAECN